METRSETRPAGNGQLPMRILLHPVRGERPWATHLEVEKPEGWITCAGEYYKTEDDARSGYRKRCVEIGVEPDCDNPMCCDGQVAVGFSGTNNSPTMLTEPCPVCPGPPDCPECELLASVSDQSQVIGEFLEWMEEAYCDDVRLPRVPIEKMLARFFGVDLDKVETERRALLDFIRGDAG